MAILGRKISQMPDGGQVRSTDLLVVARSGDNASIQGSSVMTDLSNTPSATDVLVSSSTGNDTTLPAATTTKAGVMTAADKVKLNAAISGGDVPAQADTDLSNTPNSYEVKIFSSTGNDTVIEAATSLVAGVMTAADKLQLMSTVSVTDLENYVDPKITTLYNTLTTGVLSNVPNNETIDVTYTLTGKSTTTTLPAATITDAGLMTADDKDLLDRLKIRKTWADFKCG